MSRKKHPSLLDEYREQLDQWLIAENLSLDDARAKLRGVWKGTTEVPSRSALSRWAATRRQERVLERIAESARSANALQTQIEANPSDVLGNLLGLIGHEAFRIQMEQGEKPDVAQMREIAELLKIGLKARHDDATLKLKQDQLALQERRVALLERQAADATAVLSDDGLTAEQMTARFREIFGMPAAKS